MRDYFGLTVVSITALLMATPALAQGSTAIPEPTDLALFALGIVGIVLGRRGARRKPPRD